MSQVNSEICEQNVGSWPFVHPPHEFSPAFCFLAQSQQARLVGPQSVNY